VDTGTKWLNVLKQVIKLFRMTTGWHPLHLRASPADGAQISRIRQPPGGTGLADQYTSANTETR